MPAFPIHDWEFWVATGIAIFAAAWLLRGVLPIPWLSSRMKRKKHERRVTLTVEGQRPEKLSNEGERATAETQRSQIGSVR